MLFRFSLRRYIPEIFAIKFESCGKSRRILNIFYPPKFSMGTPCKISVRYHPTSHEPHPLVKFREVTPTTPKVIGAHNWILRPILNVRPWNFLGDPRPGLWCALATLGQTLACVKISGASAPYGRNVVWAFFTLPNFTPLVKLVSTWSPRLWATSPGKISWGYAHYPKVIGTHMWIFKPNFKCSPLKYLGTPYPVCVR